MIEEEHRMATLSQVAQLISAKKQKLEDLKTEAQHDVEAQLERDLEFLQTYSRLLSEAEEL